MKRKIIYKTIISSALIMVMIFCLISCAGVKLQREEDSIGLLEKTEPASGPSGEQASKEQAGPGEDAILQITVDDAILMALENNRALKVQRYNPAIKRVDEYQERAQCHTGAP